MPYLARPIPDLVQMYYLVPELLPRLQEHDEFVHDLIFREPQVERLLRGWR